VDVEVCGWDRQRLGQGPVAFSLVAVALGAVLGVEAATKGDGCGGRTDGVTGCDLFRGQERDGEEGYAEDRP
jgi:hypothetical protein